MLNRRDIRATHTHTRTRLPFSILNIAAQPYCSSLLIVYITCRKQMHAQDVCLKGMTSSLALLFQGVCTSNLHQNYFVIYEFVISAT